MEWNEPGGMTARPQVELPELPDAVMHNSIERGYNARQMHAYARQAIAESEVRAELELLKSPKRDFPFRRTTDHGGGVPHQ